MFFFLLVLVAVVAVRRSWDRPRKKTQPLLYKRGELQGGHAVFPCGCRFDWARPDNPPTICQAHRVMIDATVDA